MVKLHLGPLAWEIPSWRKVLKRFEDCRAYFGTSKALWKFRIWGCDLSDSLSSPQGVSPGVTLEKYEKEQRFVASSAANMLAIMEKSVEPGVIIKQPEPLALWSNLFWNFPHFVCETISSFVQKAFYIFFSHTVYLEFDCGSFLWMYTLSYRYKNYNIIRLNK